MGRKEVRHAIRESNEDIIFLDTAFDDAIVGYIEGAATSSIAVYDKFKIIEILKDDWGFEDVHAALDYFYTNMTGYFLGKNTPVYITFVSEEDI